jgi:hypothetical protein
MTSLELEAMLAESSIKIARHQDDVHTALASVIEAIFPLPEEDYLAMGLEDYRAVMLKAQLKLIEGNFVSRVIVSIKAALESYLATEKFLVQSNLYLRAARPGMPRHYENIDWHRESFYGPNLEKSVNIWTPIRGVTSKNSLRYIPKSHTIPDQQIITSNEGSTVTPKYSVGHQLGFNYDPKAINSGVDLSQAETLLVPEQSSAIFSGNLIHGAAINLDSKIRFSIDFQVIRKSDYSARNKKFHFSSRQPYFVEHKF